MNSWERVFKEHNNFYFVLLTERVPFSTALLVFLELESPRSWACLCIQHPLPRRNEMQFLSPYLCCWVSRGIRPWSLRNCSLCGKTFPNWSLQILHLVENYKWMARSRTRWFTQACGRAADESLLATVATRQMLVLSHFKLSAVAALSIVARDIVPAVPPKTDLSNVTNDPLGTSDQCRVFFCKSLLIPRFVHSGCNFSCL